MSSSVSHLDVPFPIGYIYSTEPDSGRNGLGVQEWPDGSKYEGEFVNDLKHGVGVYSWPNGEIYEGSFYKDYRHGKGTYTWPDGSKFSGKFYLNRKEGYGVQLLQDGSFFKGLYHADERFGPGVLTYADGRQDVGLWHRCRLFSLCTWLKDAFSLRSLPDFQSQQSRVQTGITLQGDPQNLRPELPKSTICKDPLVFSPEEMLKDERFILPPDTLRYANDPDHLPLPPRIRKHLDELFFSSSNPDTPVHTHTQVYTHTYGNTSCLPLQERMQEHINRHRCEVEALDWDVGAVLSMRREAFGPKGPLELGSERLIKEAARGDPQTVYHILRDGRIHPDVGDAQGHTPLLAATVNCHNEVINMLLDSGANVNKLNTEGMSALAICHVLYYPTSSLHTTVAELRLDRDSPKPQVSVPKSPQADNQEDEASKNLTSPVPQKTESPDQSHSANEETAAPGHTQADPGEAPPLSSPVMEEEPAESNRGTAGRDMTFDPESTEQRVASDSVVSLASFQIAVSKEALDQAAEALCHSGLLPAEGTQETVHKIALAKTQRSERWATLRLLLSRGADPNASLVPMPVLFLAIKAAHTHAVQLLLEAGARTDICLPSELNGLYPLHVAAGLPGDEGPRITELLLHAVADPDVQAQDTHVLFELDKNTPDPQGGSGNKPGNVSGAPPQGPGTGSPDRGRTPLHIACQRDQDHKNARDAVCVLLSHKASTSLLWSGHSPLSLAIASGNHLAVDVLLAWGADPNLPLSCRVGSALCANANIAYDCGGTHSCNRILLLEKLIKAGADILLPILIGEGRRCVIGTAVDYAYCSFNQDWRIAHTPYHALNPRERGSGDADSWQQRSLSINNYAPQAQASEENTSTGTISTDGKEEKRSVRKQDFKYCYQCGRSVGVVLLACSRCHEVFYCSKTCKMKAWNDRHKEECVRVQGQDHSEPSDTLESDPQRENTGNIKKASVKTPEQPSLITQMQAHFKKKMIVEKLNKKRKALSQKWAEKRLASGNQSKGWSAGAKGQSGLPKHPPKTPTYDPTENYSYI
ncbi:hypothetical protein AALO_G00131060 [Alosa alosa]|uniref:MYND-type domain-containing protein n=1 Tax=Alosa alosa TaxID=278164 RepID=A0AAV6GS35_9TELE|nr:hypothetical protein AALO_G00131060 [Alosa alosa]